MKTHKFARKPFYVDAVRVSESNMEDATKWCDGQILSANAGSYISVKVRRPLTDRQTQAFVGDWILSTSTGYKVYTSRAFEKSFEKVKQLSKAQADEAGIFVPHEPRQKTGMVVATQKGSGVRATVPAAEFKAPVPTAPKVRVVDAGVTTEIDTEANPPVVVPTVMPPRMKDDIDRLLES